MANYRSMYAVLCKAIDNAIASLEAIPPAQQIVADLRSALLEAEEIYITTSVETLPDVSGRPIVLSAEADK